MAKADRRKKTNSKPVAKTRQNSSQPSPEEVIRAAEKMAMAAFGAGLKLVAAFGVAAAKSASLALESLASGAGKFSELVEKETLKPPKKAFDTRTRQNSRVRKIRRKKTR